jgi:dienelactone hydrolase
VAQGAQACDLQLLRVQPLEEAGLRLRTGLYRNGDRRLAVSRFFATGQLALSDLDSGVARVLFPLEDGTHRGGPALFVPFPFSWSVRFDLEEGTAALELEENGSITRFQRVAALRYEEFSFESGGVTLRGRLSLPPEPGVYPAVVAVHGSGPATRDHTLHWPDYFGAQRFAFLGFDKRGCGESEGVYSARNIVQHTKQRGLDVRAAVQALKEHPEIDPEKVGLMGASQAGWVSAVAAEEGDCAFVIVRNGGAVCYAQEGRFSVLARELESKASNPSIESILPEVRRVKADYDWTPHFASMTCPSLFLYGLRDRVNPSQLCIEFLHGIAERHTLDFTIREFPTGSHAMFDARIGGMAELGTLDRSAPGYIAAIESWLEEKRLLPVED